MTDRPLPQSADPAPPVAADRPGQLPRRADPNAKPVRPKDSASLLVLRRRASGTLEVLMGKRQSKAVFGGVYVFPGGKVDRADRKAAPATPADEGILARISAVPDRARSFTMAAVRETFEETGLLLAAAGDVGDTGDEGWEAMRALGLAPDLARLGYIGHAITPPSRAVRFNARFVMAWAEELGGDLGGSGELDDLGYLPVADALERPLVDVTKFMLHEILRRDAAGFDAPDGYPFFSHRGGRRYARYV